jgi:two-component system, OmpR family, response regulator VicR
MPKRILIIDDDPDILEILDIIFKEEGYDVKISETGEEARDLHQLNPDLVLLDVGLPGSPQNGAEICANIKSVLANKGLPVILISAEDNLALISMRCGADGYISKPFNARQIIRKVKELLAA